MLNSKIEQQRVSFHEMGAYITKLLPSWKLLELKAFGSSCSVCAKAGAIGVGVGRESSGRGFYHLCELGEHVLQPSPNFLGVFLMASIAILYPWAKKKTFVKHSSAD
jgi:hypothetical protein